MELFDTHAHLDDQQFEADADAVVERAGQVGVSRILAVGTTLESSRCAVRLAHRHAGVYAAVGIHPNCASQAAAGDWAEIAALTEDARVVAVGETGLDRYWDYAPFAVQQEYFARHLELARKQGLPVVVHCRDSEADILEMLHTAAPGQLRGVMHSFCSDLAVARECLGLGLFISFAGQVTFKNRKFNALRQIVPQLPPDRLLIETDSPYLSPEPLRGRRNEPAHICHTATQLSQLLGMDAADLALLTTQNALSLFEIP